MRLRATLASIALLICAHELDPTSASAQQVSGGNDMINLATEQGQLPAFLRSHAEALRQQRPGERLHVATLVDAVWDYGPLQQANNVGLTGVDATTYERVEAEAVHAQHPELGEFLLSLFHAAVSITHKSSTERKSPMPEKAPGPNSRRWPKDQPRQPK